MSSDSTPADHERIRLETAIAALVAQRASIASDVIDAALAPLQARLAVLDGSTRDEASRALRQVTILFLDVVGSTRLSERLDAEDTHSVMKGALARFASIVEHHGGNVLQYTGDGLLAGFGVEATKEDDAERAVRAGLALLDEGRRQRDSVRSLYRADDFDVRVGAHTGVVLVGDGIDAPVSIRGVAVNVAARMEQTAPAGVLRISRDTWRQLRGRFEGDEQPPLEVKGITSPVVSYFVRRDMPRTFASGESAPAPSAMVGRDLELARLLETIEATIADRTLRTFTVVGDAGLGKSRLLHEVETRMADDRIAVLHGRAQRYGIDVPYGVFRDLLAWHCGILDSDAPAIARAKLVAVFGATFDERADERSALVGQLIGLDFSQDPHIAGIVRDGRQIRARAFHAMALFLAVRCEKEARAILVLLDDLHWADAGSVDLIDHIATQCAASPIVIGCFARPLLLEHRPTWANARRADVRIELGQLGAESGEQLIDALFPRDADAPDELRSLVLANADGNPFHIQELLGMLLDDGIVVPGADGWRVDHARLACTRVPTTLTAILHARLDALPASEKRALQQESVIGSTFWDAALRALAPSALDAIEPLLERDLIRARAESTFVGAREYDFKHHLLHQVTYDTVLKAMKRDLHQKTADWLVSMTGERIGEHLGLIAGHYESAANTSAASRYLHRAADAAYWTGAYIAARTYLGRAFALADLDPRVRFELHFTNNHINNATGRRNEQDADVAAMTALAESIGEDALRARAWRQQVPLSMLRGDPAAALEVARRAERLAAQVGDIVTRVGAMIEGAQALIYLRRLDEAGVALESALPLIRTTDRRDLESIARGRLEQIASARGDFETARAQLELSLAIDRSLANRYLEASGTGNLAVLEFRLGNLARARELGVQSLETKRASGSIGTIPYSMDTLAMIDLEEGRSHEALSQLIDALRLIREAGDRFGERIILLDLVDCHAAVGDTAAALECLDAYQRAAPSASDGSAGDAAKAALLIDAGRLAEAEPLVSSIALSLEHPPSGEDGHDARPLFVCHRYFASVDDPRAGEFLRLAHAALMRPAARMDEDARRAYLSNLRLHREILAAWAAGGGD